MTIQSYLENMKTASHLLESFRLLNHNTMLYLTYGEKKIKTYKIVPEAIPLMMWLFI